MFQKIVVGYNGSKQSADALALGGALANTTGGRLLVGYVYFAEPRWYGSTRDYLRDQRERSHATLEPALATLPQAVAAETTALGSSSPARGLHDLAAMERADLVVVGSTHHGPVGRVVIGPVGELLLSAAPFAVAVAPRGLHGGAGGSITTVAAAFDGSPESQHALRGAASLAARLGARMRVVSAIERSHGWQPSGPGEHGDHHHGGRAELERDLEQSAASVLGGLDSEHLVVEGNPAAVLEEAAGSVDLLVVGSRGYGPVRHALLGSVSAKLMRSSAAPVVVIPRGGPAGAEAGASQASPASSSA